MVAARRYITRLLLSCVLGLLASVALADGTYQFVDVSYTRTETDTNQVINLRIQRTGGTGPEDVTIRGSGVPAGAGNGNYFGSTGATDTIINIPGNGTFNVPFTIVGDNDTQADVTVNFAFQNFSAGGAVAGLGATSLNILDDDVASYSFSAANFSAVEGDAGTVVVTVTVNRTGATGDEEVQMQVGGGTATPGAAPNDYTGNGVILRNFVGGQTSRDFDITINGDTILEPDETIDITFLSFEVLGVTGAIPTATLTIENDDQSIGFSDTNYGTPEGDVASSTNVVELVRTGDLNLVQNVEVSVVGGVAIAGTDFAAGPYNTAFAVGASTATINVGILGDIDVEGDEDIQLEITQVDAGTDFIDLANNQATLVIEDDDAATYRFSSATFDTPEGNAGTTSIPITVERTGGLGVEDITVQVTGTSATPGSDYVNPAGGVVTLNFGALDTSQVFNIDVNGDTDLEPDEAITLTIVGASGSGTIGLPDVATLNILNDETQYRFANANVSTNEGDLSNFTNVLVIERLGDTSVAENVTVDDLLTGTATSATDYAAGPWVAAFGAGDTTATVPISIIGDLETEPDETINVEIVATSGTGTIGVPNLATLTLLNDDIATYEFSEASYTALEGDAVNTVSVVQITRTGATDTIEDVTVNLTNGTAASGDDFTPGPVIVNFGAGDTVQLLDIDILGDTDFEADETINVALALFSNGGQAGTQSDTELIIENDDQRYTFTSVGYTVDEGAGPVTTVTIEREGPPVTENVVVNITGGDADEGAGNDYLGATMTTFEAAFTAAGPDVVAIDLNVLEDGMAEDDETIEVEIDGAFNTGTPDSAIITILDNDAEYEFSAATFSQPEGNVTADATVVIIERSGATNTAATVTVALADGVTPPSANFGTDYTAGPVDVDFAAGDATAIVPLEILGDTTSEDDETIDLTITNVPTGSMIGTQDTATLTLTNDDGLPNFSFTSATYDVTETNGNNIETTVVTLTRTDTSNAADVVVNYVPPVMPPTASSSTAEQGVDFFVQDGVLPNNVTCTPFGGTPPPNEVFPCTVNFAAGEATAVLPISIIGDTDIEISERIVLTFATGDITSTPTGVATVPNTTVLTIIDNDGPSGADLRVLNGTSATSPTIPNGTSNAIIFPLTSLNVPVEREFTLRNTGDSVLNIFSINLPANFSLVSGFPNTLAGNTSETFTIRFDAGVGGTSGGLVEIASSDFADNPYVFPIQGSIEATEIDVTIDGQPLVDGSGSIDFGSTIIGTPVTRTITISNGTGVSLLLSNLNLPDGYSLVGNFPTNVAGGGSETATFQLDAAAVGVFTGTLSFDTNDEDESTYDIALTGTVTDTPQPEIQVAGPQGGIESGGSYDFGSNAIGTSPSATFTVSNGGTADLTLDRASLTSSLVGTAFSVTDDFAETTLAVGQSTSFEVTLDGSAAGNFNATLSFANNDADENPFGIDLSGEVSAPEIEVRADTRVLQDGSSVPVDFGGTTLNNVVPQTFTINNLGGVALTLGGLDLPDGFVLDGDFPTTVDANGSATFTLNLTATGLGTFAGEVSFDTNDEDENPFSFRVEGVVDDAQLVVLDGLLTVANGSTVDFGSTTLDNAITKIFTIRNDGGANLQVDNLSTLPAGFELLSPDSFTFDLAPNQEATFTVSLTAETVDDFSGALQFVTNDTSASPFSITIEGRVTAEPAPEISVSGSDGAISSGSGFTFDDLPVGEDITETFTVTNIGTAALTLGSVTVSGDAFTLSGDLGTTSLAPNAETTFSVRFEGDDEGDATGSVSIENNDDNENPYVFDLDGTVFVPQPEIAVLRDGDVISDGGSVDLGTVTTGESVTETFTVRNDGDAELTLDNLAVSGTGFEVSSGLGDTSLDPDATTTFTIRFNAGDTAGDASGDISLGSNDDDENPFDISLTADVDVPQPEIEVLAGNSLVSDGGTLEFSPIATGEAVTLTVRVRNAGTATLNLEPLEITGTGFSLVSPFGSTTLEPSADTTFDIRFDAVNRPVGDYSGSISFANNDSDENPYNFTLNASVFVPAPEIEVLGPSGENVTDGLGVVDASSIDLGGVGVGQTRTATFTVRNTGDAALTLNSASLASSLSGTVFSVQSTFGQTSLAPSASTSFTLAVDTSAAGTFRNVLSFNNNDDDENPFNFAISTTVSAGPEVEVRDGAVIIPDGSATAVSIGTTQVGTAIQKDLAVFNVGSAALNLSGFSVTGDAFTIVSTPSGTLAAGQSGVLTIQLDGDTIGTPTAQVSFNTNDPDENPYTFTARGVVNEDGNGGGGGGDDAEVTVRPGTNQPPVTIVAQPGDANVAVLQALFSLQEDVPARVTQVEASVFASLDGTRTKVTTTQDFAGFASAKLYIDSNNNGQVDLSDALLGTTTRFDAGSGNLVFNLPSPLALSSTQATNVIIAYDFLATLGDNSLPLVALAGLLPLALLWFGRFRRTSLAALLIVLMVACGGDGDDGNGPGNGNGGPDPDTVYQAVLVDASAEANGNAIDVSFPNGEIGGSNVTVRE